MNAVAKIEARPFARPIYVSTAVTLISLCTWVEANRVALIDYFEQLREHVTDGQTDCEFGEFCGVQFDRERDLRDRFRNDCRESRREWSNYDRGTGIAKYGEI